ATMVLCDWRDQIGDTLSLLRQLAEDSHPQVRLQAVRAASFIHDIQAVEAALSALNHPTDPFIEYVLDQTLRQLEPVWHAALRQGRTILPEHPPAMGRLLSRVNDEMLLALPRQEAVHRAILLRGSV